jgi:3'(2'), 5'-bisphosphate nucleotidase
VKTYERELTTAVALAREAGRILMEVYAGEFGVDFKGASDPVTEADRRANAFLVQKLRAAFPRDGVIAEESGADAGADLCDRCWYVDPLDGTKEFIAKNGEFSVMLGLAVNGHPKLGVMYQPEHDKLYRGIVGRGAFLERAGATTELRVSDTAEPANLRLVVSRSHRPKGTDELVRRLGVRSESPSGSVGLKVGHIAERNADFYVHLSGHASRWDSCGPEAVLVAAGGRMTDLFGDAIDYDGRELSNRRGILACNAAAFDAVVSAVREIAAELGFT